MSILTKQHIYRPGRGSDLPALQALGLTGTPAGFPLTVLDRKTRKVRGGVWREIITDENYRFLEERLTVLAGNPHDKALFAQDVRRAYCQPQNAAAPETQALAAVAMQAFRNAFPAAIMQGSALLLPNGNGCQLLLRADALPCGLLLTAGMAPVQPMLPAGPMLRTLLTLRLWRYADSPEDIVAFIADALHLHAPLADADRKALKSAHDARQKQFLQCMTDALLPLGFRKKGMRWVLPAAEDASVVIEAVRHRFGDQLLFDLYTERSGKPVGIPLRLEQDLDWQQLSPEDVHDLIQIWSREDVRPLTNQIQGG